VAVTGSRLLFVAALFASTVLLAGCGTGASSQSRTTVPTYQIVVTPPPQGAGTITSNPPGISCPSTCKASFPLNTQVTLTAKPAASYSFGGWTGDCSGTNSCSLTVNSSETVSAIFAPGSSGAKVIAYVFTPDAVELNSPQFSLLSNGQLRPTSHTVQPLLMTGTSHGVVMNTTANGAPTRTLQSYAVKSDGSLRPQGKPVAVAMERSLTLASDQTYVYAASDEGIFGFADASIGLSPLLPVQETVPPPGACTAAEENANRCQNSGWLMLSNASAFFLQSFTGQAGLPVYEMSTFVRSQGELTSEQYFLGDVLSTSVFAPTPDGSFLYALDLASNRIFRYARSGNGAYEANILSNGQQLSDGFVQLMISSDGQFLFAAVSEASESPRIRVFQIAPSSGNLTEVKGSPFLTGEYYLVRTALDPTGRFLLAIHAYCDGSPPCLGPGKLVAMSINPSTGALTVTSDVDDGQDPFAVVAVPISD
jgi:Divergent InlB B-repeat domain